MAEELRIFHISEVESLTDPEVLRTDMQGFNEGGYLRGHSGDLVFIGGRPGTGKTMLALQIADIAAMQMPVLFFSLEMTKEQLKARLARDRRFSPAKGEFYIYSPNSIHIKNLCEVAYVQNKETPLGLIVIDYAQIVQTEGRSKAEEVGAVVRALKELAVRVGCPVIALAQLNRNIESRASAAEFVEPQMSDFADSAEIEKWADCCLIMHRVPKSDGIVKVHCVKNRHGDKKDFNLRLNRKNLRFEDSGEI